jgi:hypothetical protein
VFFSGFHQSVRALVEEEAESVGAANLLYSLFEIELVRLFLQSSLERPEIP